MTKASSSSSSGSNSKTRSSIKGLLDKLFSKDNVLCKHGNKRCQECYDNNRKIQMELRLLISRRKNNLDALAIKLKKVDYERENIRCGHQRITQVIKFKDTCYKINLYTMHDFSCKYIQEIAASFEREMPSFKGEIPSFKGEVPSFKRGVIQESYESWHDSPMNYSSRENSIYEKYKMLKKKMIQPVKPGQNALTVIERHRELKENYLKDPNNFLQRYEDYYLNNTMLNSKAFLKNETIRSRRLTLQDSFDSRKEEILRDQKVLRERMKILADDRKKEIYREKFNLVNQQRKGVQRILRQIFEKMDRMRDNIQYNRSTNFLAKFFFHKRRHDYPPDVDFERVIPQRNVIHVTLDGQIVGGNYPFVCRYVC